MRKLGIVVLGLISGIFLTSFALAWCPWYGGWYHGAQQPNINYSKEIAKLKNQISEKQAELAALYAQKKTDPKKINQLHQKIRDLYQKLNQIYYSNPPASPTGAIPPYPYYSPPPYPHPYHGYHCCPWW